MPNSVFRNINEVHIEITNMCNLSCTYCYAETLLPGRDKPKNLFTNQLYRETITRILSETNSNFVDVVFHGGEPLLHDAGWFDEACTFAVAKGAEIGKTLTFSMQSNLTLLREGHTEVFRKYNVMIGVSLDGDKETHNSMRGNFTNTALNIQKLQKLGLLSGVIVVISHHNWDKMPDFFRQLFDMNIGTFHMNIASAVGRGNPMEHLGTDKTFRAFKDCVDCMLAYDGKVIDTRMIQKIRLFLKPPKTGEETFTQLRCDNMFCHAGVTMVSVQYDGNVFPCGCAGSSGNTKNFQLVNITSKSDPAPAEYYGTLRRFHEKKDKYFLECVRCPAKFVCEHGCPAFDHTDAETPENTCLATKKLYQYLNALDRASLEDLVAMHPVEAAVNYK